MQKLVATNGVGIYMNKFLYDGWNLVAELNPNNTPVRTYVWGSDLSGQTGSALNGAGGVGGLLEITYYGSSTTNCFPAYDGNGNVAALINAADGTVAANYEYGPFGEVIRNTGPMGKVNPFRFSTDYYDDESDIIMYPRRPYSPSAGRFLTRDPIGEKGGVNLYDLVANNPVNENDPLGLCNIKIRCGPVVRAGITVGWHCGVIAPTSA
jgi:RHS repeat-associated protein